MTTVARVTTQTASLLREQWETLRRWLEAASVLDHAVEPSGLGAWTVADLVVHLGYGLRMVAEVTPASEQEQISVTRYVAGYAPAQQQIATDTTAVAARLRGRELAGIDELAAEAWQAVEHGLPPVVLGRRGALRSDDFLWTRLLELVVHGDDLHRVLGFVGPSPLVPAAVERVAEVLARGYEEATGRPAVWSGIDMVRVATGRVTTDDPALPLLS